MSVRLTWMLLPKSLGEQKQIQIKSTNTNQIGDTDICRLIQALASPALQYRLRCPLGFWNKKWTKVDACFSVKNTPKPKLMNFYQNMTQFLYQKSFSENKYGQNHGQCSEKVERGLSKGQFFVWWKYRPCREKKF